jgi:indolepyruvate ferredoxin oxidoreductase
MRRKITIGTWATPAFRLLAKGKALRGTVFDPFRWPLVRRVERELAQEYVDAIDRVLSHLDATNLDAAIALAELPDGVRGYEDIKLARVATYREKVARAVGANVDAQAP